MSLQERNFFQYFRVIKLSFLDMFEYRFDFVIHILKYSFSILLIALVWLAVAKEQTNAPLTPTQIIGYFTGSAIIYSLSNFHPYYLEDDIRLGTLSKYLVRPTHPFPFYFAFEATIGFVELVVRAIVLVPILILLGAMYQPDLVQLFLFLVYLPLIFFCAFTLFWIISTGAFWVQEVFAIRWSLTIFFRLLSGILVPLTYFPAEVRPYVFWLPFQHFAYTPIQLLQGNLSIGEGLQGFGILLGWSVILTLIRRWWWQFGLNQYEGAGI